MNVFSICLFKGALVEDSICRADVLINLLCVSGAALVSTAQQ